MFRDNIIIYIINGVGGVVILSVTLLYFSDSYK